MNPSRRIATALATALVFLSLATTAAQASDSIYWVNYDGDAISNAGIAGGGGKDVPIPAGMVNGPYGLVLDAAKEMVYWANFDTNNIGYASLNGGGSGFLNTAGAPIESPSGLALDPTANRLYWTNAGTGGLGFASLSGSGGGPVNTSGATVDRPYGIVAYPPTGRIYWANYGASKISYANLDGSGGGDLDTTGAPVEGPAGVAVDAANGRIYWANYDSNTIGFANISGGGGGQLETAGAPIEGPAGVAVDPISGFVYWANEDGNSVAYHSISGGTGGRIETNGATADKMALPALLITPHPSSSPEIQGKHRPGSTLSCSSGSWRGDLPESFFSQAPRNLSYAWFRNGKAVTGATTASLIANKVGTYSCVVTATNFAGSESAVNDIDFAVNATVAFKKVTFNRKKGTATVRLAVTGAGRLDAYGKGIANASRKHVSGTAKIVLRASGKALIKLRNTGKTKVKATIAYTPEGGKAIKRRKTVVLKKKLRR